MKQVAKISISRGGYTLVELITVTSLAITLLSFSALVFYRLGKFADVDSAAQKLSSALTYARSLAVTRLTPTKIKIERNERGDRIVISRRTHTTPCEWLPASAGSQVRNVTLSIGRLQSGDGTPEATQFEELKADEIDENALFFRSDGSMCLSENEIEISPSDDKFAIRLTFAHSDDTAGREVRLLKIDTRTGGNELMQRESGNDI